MRACVHVCICMYMYVCMYVCSVCMYVCDTCACTSTYTVYMYIMYVRMYVRLYIYISLYVCYTYKYQCVSMSMCTDDSGLGAHWATFLLWSTTFRNLSFFRYGYFSTRILTEMANHTIKSMTLFSRQPVARATSFV